MTRGAPFAWWASPEQRARRARSAAAPAAGAGVLLQRRPFSKPTTAPQPGAKSAQIIPFMGGSAQREPRK